MIHVHTHCNSTTPTPLFFLSPAHPVHLPPMFMVSVYKSDSLSPISPVHIPMGVWGHSLECGQTIRGHTHPEKIDSNPTPSCGHQPPIASQLGWGLVSPSPTNARMLASCNSHATCRRQHFPVLLPILWLFYAFCSLSTIFPEPGGWGVDTNVSLRSDCSTAACSQCFYPL